MRRDRQRVTDRQNFLSNLSQSNDKETNILVLQPERDIKGLPPKVTKPLFDTPLSSFFLLHHLKRISIWIRQNILIL